jgi:hypothetical protein
MGEWQSIESAPKDGRTLLMWAPGFGLGALVLYWMDGYWREPANGLGLKVVPTHWMALPPSPIRQSV